MLESSEFTHQTLRVDTWLTLIGPNVPSLFYYLISYAIDDEEGQAHARVR